MTSHALSASNDRVTRGLSRAVLILWSLVMLWLCWRYGIQHDYRDRYLSQWQLLLDGADPWKFRYIAYGPFHVVIGFLLPWGNLAPKFFMVGALLMANAALVLELIRERGRNPIQAIYLLAVPTNILVVGVGATYGLNDTFVAALLVVAVLLRHRGHLGTAGLFIGLAALTTYYPLLLLPFFALDGRRLNWSVIESGIAVFCIGLAAAVAIWGQGPIEAILHESSREPKTLSILAATLQSPFGDERIVRFLIQYNNYLVVSAVAATLMFAWWARVNWLEGAVLGYLVLLTTYKIGHQQYYLPWLFMIAGLPLVNRQSADRMAIILLPPILMLSLYHFGYEFGSDGYHDELSWVRSYGGFIAFPVGVASITACVINIWMHRHIPETPKPESFYQRSSNLQLKASLFRPIGEILEHAGIRQRTPLWALALALFGAQFIQLTYWVAQVADSQPIQSAVDNDAGNAINVAARSRWYNDNHYAPYGPLYFRLANTLAAVLTPMSEPGGLVAVDAQGKAVSFALLAISECALFGLALVLSLALTGSFTWMTVLIAPLFVWALLFSGTWQNILLQAHPDYLLSLFAAAAAASTHRLWLAPEDRNLFRITAWLWGLAIAVKMSAALFLPFLLGSLLYPNFRAGWRRIPAFVGHMAVAYFAVGFPQSLNVPVTILFLLYQSQYSTLPSWTSVTEWLTVWRDQGLVPFSVTAALLGAILWNSRRGPARAQVLVKSVILGLGPLTLLFLQAILSANPHDYYVMPVLAAQLALLIQNVKMLRHPTISDWTGAAVITLSLIFFSAFGLVPAGMNATLTERLKCRPEARAMYVQVMHYSEKGLNIFADPYVPTPPKSNRIRSSWQANKNYIMENRFQILALRANYYERFFNTEMDAYVNIDVPDPGASRDFYALFRNADFVHDGQLGSWQRVYRDACTGEIWQKVE